MDTLKTYHSWLDCNMWEQVRKISLKLLFEFEGSLIRDAGYKVVPSLKCLRGLPPTRERIQDDK